MNRKSDRRNSENSHVFFSDDYQSSSEIAAEIAAENVTEIAAEVIVEGVAETEAGTAVERAVGMDIFPARTDVTLTVTVEAWSPERMNYIHTATQREIYRVDRTLFATDAHMRTI
jgi:hypothetical protein